MPRISCSRATVCRAACCASSAHSQWPSSQANDLMSSLDRDKPFPYASLCATLVYINIVIMSTWKGVEWSVWLYNYGDDIVCQPIFWLDLLVLFSWNLSVAILSFQPDPPTLKNIDFSSDIR